MTTAKTKSVWERLSKIDVSDHTEKKGNLTYLSWAWAWGTLKNEYPGASFHKHFFDHISKDGEMKLPYTVDGEGYAYVRVTVTSRPRGAAFPWHEQRLPKRNVVFLRR